ncbi:Lrp/AsnC family transcriptional regulator [Kordiimonas pumila]|uniref:Lrp/AsnC family transcriptional regulator n=1 Tax=Kordiimonas pumila TaxID=2161677 RepID=A0ABV7D2X4_9PROT|nr:Lrp/AsnC family transcriptional regulator [Kordiimonas pumila]
MTDQLDALDRKILEILQEDVTLSLSELAEKVASSKSVCWRRVQAFLDAGIIKSRVAVLDAKKLGLGVMIIAMVKLDGRVDSSLEDFVNTVQSIPEVIECHALMGEVDVMLKLIVPTIEYYEEMMWKRLARLPGIIDLRSSISLSRFVDTTKLPLATLEHDPRRSHTSF